MTIHDTFVGAQFATTLASIVARHGIRLEIGSDFDRYADIIGHERSDQPLGQPLNPNYHRFTEENAFWITGWNEAGELVSTQAMRKIDIAPNLADYLSRNFHAFPPPAMEIDFENSRYTPGPGARQIRGTVGYHGDVWLKNDPAYRGTGISSLLARFALISAALRWSPDYIFAFSPEKYAFRGLIEREGYMHAEPGALAWKHKDKAEFLHGFMIWLSREDLAHLMTIDPERLIA